MISVIISSEEEIEAQLKAKEEMGIDLSCLKFDHSYGLEAFKVSATITIDEDGKMVVRKTVR